MLEQPVLSSLESLSFLWRLNNSVYIGKVNVLDLSVSFIGRFCLF